MSQRGQSLNARNCHDLKMKGAFNDPNLGTPFYWEPPRCRAAFTQESLWIAPVITLCEQSVEGKAAGEYDDDDWRQAASIRSHPADTTPSARCRGVPP